MEEIKTNLGKTKSQIIYELLLSINNGNPHVKMNTIECVNSAKEQYERLVKEGIIVEYKQMKG